MRISISIMRLFSQELRIFVFAIRKSDKNKRMPFSFMRMFLKNIRMININLRIFD